MSLAQYLPPGRGFTLLEMAILLFVLSLALGGLLPTLATQAEQRNRQQAYNELLRVREALFGYAIVHRRLPCPATSASSGIESPSGGGDCTQTVGFLPAVTLGLLNGDTIGNVASPWHSNTIPDRGLMLDPWGHPYLYAVHQANDCTFKNTNDLTTSGEITIAFNCAQPGLKVYECMNCDSDLILFSDSLTLADETLLTEEAVALIFSQGRYTVNTVNSGRYQLEGANVSRADAVESNLSNTEANKQYNVFVTAAYNGQESPNRFDDIMLWLSPKVLHQRLLNARLHGEGEV